jgi:hypothetical protein
VVRCRDAGVGGQRDVVARAIAARTWRSISLLAPMICCAVVQRTLGAAIGKVVSKRSPFGRSLAEVKQLEAEFSACAGSRQRAVE